MRSNVVLRLLSAVARLSGGGPAPRPDVGDGVPFDEAINWHLARLKPSDAEWEETRQRSKRRALTVANLAHLDLVTDVHEALERALANGTTLQDFKKEIGDKLKADWGGTVANPGARLETIFRTNVQLAYGSGRFVQAKSVSDTRPFWRYDAILDGRTTAICRPLNGKVIRSDDDWWKTHLPPLHFNCRSTIVTLTAEQADAEGVTQAPPAVAAQEGFGHEPDAQEQVLATVVQRKLADAPPALAAAFATKDAQARAVPPPGHGPRDLPPALPRSSNAEHQRVIEAFGDRLRLEDMHHPTVQKHLDDLALLPEELIRKVKVAGLAEVHIAAKPVPDLDSNGGLRGKAAAGWAGHTWDEVPACYNPRARSVSAGEGAHGSDSAALHEFGHSVGDLLGYDHDERLIQAYVRLWPTFEPEFKASWPIHSMEGRQEMFAEAFAAMIKFGHEVVAVSYDEEFADFLYEVITQ